MELSFRKHYFQGYARKITLDENNNTHVEYVYEGMYHVADCSAAQWAVRKVRLVLCCCLEAFLLITAMSLPAQGNYHTDMILLQVLALLLLLGESVGAFFRLVCTRRMTTWEYRINIKTPRECAQLAAVVLAVVWLDAAASAWLGRWGLDELGVWLLVLTALAAAVQAVTAHCVGKETYTEEQSRDMPNGIDITND